MSEKIFIEDQFEQLDRRFKATLLNSLNGVKTVVLVGTKGQEGTSNLAVFNSIIHIGAQPPLIGLLFRPEGEAERHTLDNIRRSGSCTLNMMHYKDHRYVHYTSAKFPAEVSEFNACGFLEEWRDGVEAPFVASAQIKLGWRLRESVSIQSNGTMLFIGDLHYLAMADHLLTEDGLVDHVAAETLLSCGLDSYTHAQNLVRLNYARPDALPGYQ